MKITLPLMLAAILLSGCGPEGQRIDATPAATKSTEPQAQWDASYGGADKGYDSALITTRDQVAPTFRTLPKLNADTVDIAGIIAILQTINMVIIFFFIVSILNFE